MNRRQIEGTLARLDYGHKGMGEEYSLFGEAAAVIRDLLKDEEPWPTPGKPETYSERYMEFSRLLGKVMAKEPLTADEAIDVWQALHALTGAVPEGGLIESINRQLADELRTGMRCGVCARHNSENYNCSYEC